jgi:protein-tyrosine phosphatase
MDSRPTGPNDEESVHSVYWITPRIAVGRYLTPERARHLRDRGVTHILNVGENPSIVHRQDFDFAAIVDQPIVDLELIPVDAAQNCVATLCEMLRSTSDSKVYVHCLAGQNRSPTIAWLFLIACGLDRTQGKRRITDRIYDAVPGHSALVDDPLIQSVVESGKRLGLTLEDAGLGDSKC